MDVHGGDNLCVTSSESHASRFKQFFVLGEGFAAGSTHRVPGGLQMVTDAWFP